MSDDALIEAMAEAIYGSEHNIESGVGLAWPMLSSNHMIKKEYREHARAALDVAKPVIERAAAQNAIEQISHIASEAELHVEELPVADGHNLSLWIWIEDEGKKLIDAATTDMVADH